VQPAGLRLDLDDGGVPLVLVDHVELHEVGLAAGVLDLLDQGVAAFLVAPGDEDRRPSWAKSRADARPMPP
jgi:hypothetical protein